jgi:oxygen-independent coproporphyrinogen-3 oxidase
LAGLYVHIPFCRQACYYCDFHFSTNRRYQQAMTEAIAKEIKLQKAYLNHASLNSIYFGGGTPSLLHLAQLQMITDAIRNTFRVNEQAEITIEANPDDLTAEKLEGLRQAGINRLSVGIQSFNDAVLKLLNRSHSAQTAIESLKRARKAGFDNISMDLIFAIPGVRHSSFEKDIQQAIALNTEHVSVYALTIEEKTVFGNWFSKGKLSIVDEPEAAAQFDHLIHSLERGGFEHYEVSNFCRKGHYARHNSAYWTDVHYLGVGPGAHSYNGTSRQYNVAHNHKYLKSLGQNIVPGTIEVLDQKAKANEFLLTTLRTKWGCDLDKLHRNFGYELLSVQPREMEMLLKDDLLRIDGNILYLSRKGIFVADDIIGRLFWD